MKNSTKMLFAFFIIIVLSFTIYYQTTNKTTPLSGESLVTEGLQKISISNRDIKEENYSGRTSVIVGDKQVAVKAREYIETRVSDFKKTADIQVPDMRKEFGADAPMTNYMIYLDAEYLDGGNAESIIISQYEYTGGANGNSSFKVFTADKKSGKILTLSDIIQVDKQTDFLKFLKIELKDWKTEGSEPIGLFEDAIDMLTFESFRNWSMNDENLTIYFNKYEIGPGVLGAMPFPIPLEKITNYLVK